jgi:hypothetical protein
MSIAAVRATFSLDPESLKNLKQLARTWQVSKSEALRRAILSVTPPKPPIPTHKRMAALHSLRKSMRDRGVDFEKWQRELRKLRG